MWAGQKRLGQVNSLTPDTSLRIEMAMMQTYYIYSVLGIQLSKGLINFAMSEPITFQMGSQI